MKTVAIISTLIALLAAKLQAGEIHDAAAAGDLNKVKALLEADPTLLESKDDRGGTPLISACWGGWASNNPELTLAVANYLIDKGANIRARGNAGATPLYMATWSFDLTQRLIAMKADVNVRAYVDSSYTPLHEAAFSGNLKVAKLLIDHGADLNFRGSVGTVLQRIIYNRKESTTEMAKLLLESGAKLQEFSFGNTELHLAVLRGCAEIIPLLVQHGADVNATNQYGHTPLFYAARHGYRKAAEALIAAGANKSAIVETNYGKAPQLSERLKEGEAYLWFLGGGSPGTGYAVKTKGHLLIFNPPGIDDSPEAGLANGYLNPTELAGQKVTVLITQSANRPVVSELARRLPGANFVLSGKPTADGAVNGGPPPYRIPGPHESFSMGGIQVNTIPAARQVSFLGAGVGYLVEADGVRIFHAGLHASNNEATQIERFRREIDFLKPFGPIDIAILPVNGRHLDIAYEPYLYLLDRLSPRAVYVDGDDLRTEEHRKCIEVLRARNVPVSYPEGGIAVGERFHYVRRHATASPAVQPADTTTPLTGETPQSTSTDTARVQR